MNKQNENEFDSLNISNNSTRQLKLVLDIIKDSDPDDCGFRDSIITELKEREQKTKNVCDICDQELSCQCPENWKAKALEKIADEFVRFNSLFDKLVTCLRTYIETKER